MDASGAPVDEGMTVLVTRCEDPVRGRAGSGTTDAEGRFSVRGSLPPIGMPVGEDSISVVCEVFAGRGFAESGKLDIMFYRPPIQPAPTEVHLVENQ